MILLTPFEAASVFWPLFGVLSTLSLGMLWIRSRFGLLSAIGCLLTACILIAAAWVWIEILEIAWALRRAGMACSVLVLAVLPAALIPTSVSILFRVCLGVLAPLLATIFVIHIAILVCLLLEPSDCVP